MRSTKHWWRVSRIAASQVVFRISPPAVFRHSKDHIAAAMVHAKDAIEKFHGETLFERLRFINRETVEILREARRSRNHLVALQAIGRVEKQVELEARLLGAMDESVRFVMGLPAEQDENADIATMTVEEMLAEQAILREAREKIEALRQPKQTLLIEAAAGTVEEIDKE